MKNNLCSLYIVRHGETDWNKEGKLQGQVDIDLNKTGQRQARLLAKKFRVLHFDAIFSSDLLRAKQTAEILALEHKLAVDTTKVLRERNFGRLEGKVAKEAWQELKKELDTFNRLPHEQKKSFRFADEETDEELLERFITFLREVAVGYQGKTVLIVCHGGLMRPLLIHLGHGSYDNWPAGTIENTGYIKLESDGVDFFVKETVGVRT